MVEAPRQVEKVLTMNDWYGNGMGSGDWLAMTAVMAIFWGLVIFGGVMIFRGRGRSRLGGDAPDRGALEILDERFAQGEVDREEYEARRAALRGKRTLTDDDRRHTTNRSPEASNGAWRRDADLAKHTRKA